MTRKRLLSLALSLPLFGLLSRRAESRIHSASDMVIGEDVTPPVPVLHNAPRLVSAPAVQTRPDLLSTFDARVWAEEFCRIFPDRADDLELMHSWFACAIMTGHDEAIRRRDADGMYCRSSGVLTLVQIGDECIDMLKMPDGSLVMP